jgi:hypothetical protein
MLPDLQQLFEGKNLVPNRGKSGSFICLLFINGFQAIESESQRFGHATGIREKETG